MRRVAMFLQLPRFRIHEFANSCWGNFYKLGKNSGSSSNYSVLCTNKFELEGGHSRKWTRRNLNAQTGGSKENLSRKTSIKSNTLKLETSQIKNSGKVIRDEIISSTKLNIKIESTNLGSDEYYTNLAKHATIICFDIETTGFSRDRDRIIEIAFQDLRGGENSTFQTLVNPEREIENTRIHGISTDMVSKSNVPRMKDLIPIIMQYVTSRQMPGGVVVFVAHNGKTFDVPFLKHEFSRHSYEIPNNWLFVDTLLLARELIKSKGSNVPSKISLQALREHYGIVLVGSAHRALSDVNMLALILQRLTYDLKLPISGLIKGAFK